MNQTSNPRVAELGTITPEKKTKFEKLARRLILSAAFVLVGALFLFVGIHIGTAQTQPPRVHSAAEACMKPVNDSYPATTVKTKQPGSGGFIFTRVWLTPTFNDGCDINVRSGYSHGTTTIQIANDAGWTNNIETTTPAADGGTLATTWLGFDESTFGVRISEANDDGTSSTTTMKFRVYLNSHGYAAVKVIPSTPTKGATK